MGQSGTKEQSERPGGRGRLRQIGILMGSGFLDLFPSGIAHF